MKMKKKEDNWFDLIAKTMIPNFELLHTDIYQPQTSACIVAYFFYNKLVKFLRNGFISYIRRCHLRDI